MATPTRTARVQSMIGGRRVPGRPYESRNPARLEDLVAEIGLVDADAVLEACRVAKAAQREWALVPAPIRGLAIQQLGQLVATNKEALARVITREIGKPYAESLGEVQEVVDTCLFFAGEGRRLYGQTVPSEMPGKQLFTFRVPVGATMIITAGNFPVAVPSWYLVPALLCGNSVVWKPAEYSGAIADAFFELFRHAGLPEDVVNIVHADGPSTFAGLEKALAAGVVDKVGFTGSTEVGTRIGELCGRYLQNPCLELGGKNPMVVMPDADMDLVVEGTLFSGFGTAGQRCTSLGCAFVHAAIHDEFCGRVDAAVRAAVVGDPSDPRSVYGPMIHERFLERFERESLALIEPHHTVMGSTGRGRITSANPREGFIGDPDAGLFCHPTLVSGVRPTDALYRTETFGPLVGIGRFEDLDEAIALANGHGYGLSASIYTNDATAALTFRQHCGAGMLSVNNTTSGAEAHLPFGGNGRSGNGSRQSGIWVLDVFTRWQAMNWDFSGRLQKAQMDVAQITADPDFRLPG